MVISLKQNIKNIIEIVLGCLISAIGVNMFIINSNLFSGGVSGIGILLNYIFSIPAGLTVIVNDVIFYSIYGGVMTGIGHGLSYANHGSEGGMDIIVMLIKRKYENFHLGQLGFLHLFEFFCKLFNYSFGKHICKFNDVIFT